MNQTAQYETEVLIVGAGPVGMLLAYQLDRLGIPTTIAEKNLETTKWPKMDLTNCRSMELLRVLGLADEYRAQAEAVSIDANFDSIFVTSLAPAGRLLGSWVSLSFQPINRQLLSHFSALCIDTLKRNLELVIENPLGPRTERIYQAA